MTFFSKERNNDKENLEESFRKYEKVVEKFGTYVLAAEEQAKEGCVSTEDLQEKAQYGKEILKRINDLDDAAKQHNVMLDEGDTHVLLAMHKDYLGKLEKINQDVRKKSCSSQ